MQGFGAMQQEYRVQATKSMVDGYSEASCRVVPQCRSQVESQV